MAPDPNVFPSGLQLPEVQPSGKGKGKGGRGTKKGKNAEGQAEMTQAGLDVSAGSTPDADAKAKKPINYKAQANAKLREGRDLMTDAKCWIHTVEKAVKDGKKLFLARDSLIIDLVTWPLRIQVPKSQLKSPLGFRIQDLGFKFIILIHDQRITTQRPRRRPTATSRRSAFCQRISVKPSTLWKPRWFRV